MEQMDTADDDTDTGTEFGVPARDVLNDETGSYIGGLAPLNLSNEIIAADGALVAGELNPALLNERATRLFTGGDGAELPPSGR